MAREIGGRQDPQIIGNASFEIGLVDKDVVDNIHLSTRKKLFKSSRFIQDEELLNDDLDLSYLVNRELNNLSASGRESPLVFTSETPSADAYSVRGRYELKENKVLIKVSLFRGQRDRLYQFDLTYGADKKEELARKIVDNIRNYLVQTENKGL
jgi:hypothetical protein